ncbi:MAG: DUF1127 domain-containing protein [Sulfurifustis sp.]
MRTEHIHIRTVDFEAAASRPPASSNPFGRVVATLGEWRTRTRQRAQLAKLDSALRRDLGLSDADIWRELRKPFWRA